MTKTELVERIKDRAGFASKASAAGALDAILEVIQDTLADGDDVTFTGFGSFKVVERAARTGRNPQTGAAIEIPSAKVIKFTPGKFLKDALN